MSIESVLRFAQLGLSAPVLEAVEAVGYEVPSPIQAKSIPPLLEGRNLLGQAQTGTGKTAAFTLPMLSRIDLAQRPPQAIILTPTRELAIQVAEAIQAYARRIDGFHVLPVYGGQPIDVQLRHLRRGVHVVVGTPGRVLDHLRRRSLSLDAIRTVVIDEADEMLRMGFIDDVEAILECTPDDKQVALFSATMPARIRAVAQRHLGDAAEISIKSSTATVSTVEQMHCTVKGAHKLEALARILETTDTDGMLVFVRTKAATLELAEKLSARGYACAALNGDLNQALRERTINRFKRGDLDIVVATDVAARGLDVDRISHVVNYDIPVDAESYVHRIGRTARAGRTGTAILFVSPREHRLLRSIEQTTGQSIAPMAIPPQQAVTDRRIERFKELVRDTIADADLAFFDRLIADLAHDDELEPRTIAAALAYLAQQDRPLQSDGHDIPNAREERGRRDERVRPGSGDRHERRSERGRVEPGKSRYRIEVGRDRGVEPKHIVGAIANEAGIEGRDIGQIKIFDRFTLVDLPEGMPREIVRHLQDVRVCGVPLRIRADGDHRTPHTGARRADERGARPAKPAGKFHKPGKPGKPAKTGHRKGAPTGKNGHVKSRAAQSAAPRGRRHASGGPTSTAPHGHAKPGKVKRNGKKARPVRG